MGSQKRKKKNSKSNKTYNDEYDESTSVLGGFSELIDMEKYKPLRKLHSYVGYQNDLGKEVFSFSNCRTMYDYSEGQKHKIRRSPQGIVLVVVVCLLTVWFLISFIYRMVTESAKVQVVLSMLPSFLIVAVCSTILLISYFGVWGKFLRWAFSHGFGLRGGDASDRAMNAAIYAEMLKTDANKATEYAVTVTEKYVSIALCGQRYNFDRDAVFLEVKMENDQLYLTFTVDGYPFEFFEPVPKKHFVDLRKTFRDKFSVNKRGGEKDGKKIFLNILSHNIFSILFGFCLAAGSVMLIVASYLWLPIPPFLGVFFLLMSGFIFCNVFSEFTIVSEIGIQLVFTLVALVIPPLAYVWIETEISGTQLTFLHILTHCSPFAAGFGFFWFMGFYALSYVICKIVDYIRFGS